MHMYDFGKHGVNKTEERHSFINIFLNRDDAFDYVNEVVSDYDLDIFEVIECEVIYVNGSYRAGIVLEKKQLELDLDSKETK